MNLRLTSVVLTLSIACACGSSGASGGNPDSGIATDSESGSSGGSSGSTGEGATSSGGGSGSGSTSSSGSSPSDGADSGSSSDGGVADSGSSSDGGVADSGPSSDGGEAGAGACIGAADMAVASMANFQTSAFSCSATNLGAEPGTLNCLEGLGLTSACATCYDGDAQCTDAHCETLCATSQISAACTSCVNTNCAPAFHACSGR